MMRLLPVLLLQIAQLLAGEPEPNLGPAVGIDLGTTYSCVGIYKNGRVEIIPNDQGNRITPSYVSFDGDERLLGEAAKHQATIHPTQTLYDVKRLIGRRFKDKVVQTDIGRLPYKIIEQGGQPMIVVQVNGQDKHLRPEEVSAMILSKMKTTAESYLGEEVKRAVITVPAYFTDAQRQATKHAGAISGLDVMRIINEPTAAAIAYGLDNGKKDEETILVYDLGGGTFDVSILAIDNGVFEVMSTNGDTHLGGEDFDQRLMQHFVEVFSKQHGAGIDKDRRAMQKLRREVEKAKRTLSSVQQARVDIEALYNGIDFSETITRAKFEDLNSYLFKKTLEPVKQALEDAGINKNKVDQLVLVGGSTRIPKIQNLLKNFFNGKEPNRGVNPDEAVAYGAAVQAGIISGAQSHDLLLLDVTPLTLGIETTGGQMSNIISRNTVIPTKKSQQYSTPNANQESTTITIFEGERPMVKDNHLLGQFQLTGFPRGPAGQAHEVTFEIDVNGILEVTAQIESTGSSKSLTIKNDASRLTEEQIEKLMREAETFAEQDKIAKERSDAKVAFESYLNAVKYSLEGSSGGGSAGGDLEEDEAKALEALRDAQQWLEGNPEAEAEEVREKHSEIESLCAPIMVRRQGGAPDEAEEEEAHTDEL